MATQPMMIRVDPNAWKELQKEAQARDLSAPQLLRLIVREWLMAHKSEVSL